MAGFNPRAHAGRDPAWKHRRRAGSRFQSTRPRGARPKRFILSNADGRFQSTRPRGARHAIGRASAFYAHVSIHAPTRGATRPCALVGDSAGVSIHAPTRGATHIPRCISIPPYCFNPRAHAGRDFLRFRILSAPRRFNPRAHAGRDLEERHPDGRFVVSIHAPTRGATIFRAVYRYPLIVSIHAPTRGATTAIRQTIERMIVSIHAPTRGAT